MTGSTTSRSTSRGASRPPEGLAVHADGEDVVVNGDEIFDESQRELHEIRDEVLKLGYEIKDTPEGMQIVKA